MEYIQQEINNFYSKYSCCFASLATDYINSLAIGSTDCGQKLNKLLQFKSYLEILKCYKVDTCIINQPQVGTFGPQIDFPEGSDETTEYSFYKNGDLISDTYTAEDLVAYFINLGYGSITQVPFFKPDLYLPLVGWEDDDYNYPTQVLYTINPNLFYTLTNTTTGTINPPNYTGEPLFATYGDIPDTYEIIWESSDVSPTITWAELLLKEENCEEYTEEELNCITNDQLETILFWLKQVCLNLKNKPIIEDCDNDCNSKEEDSSNENSGSISSLQVGNLSPLFTTNVQAPNTTPIVSFKQIKQNANLVFAGPITGNEYPTFRQLIIDDIEDLNDELNSKIESIEAGSNVTITGSGTTEDPYIINSSGGSGSSVTANNGLTLTSSNIKLGGTLIENTTINNSTFNLVVQNNSTNDTLKLINTGSGFGLNSESTNGIPGRFYTGPSSTNTVLPALKLHRGTSGSAGDGIGVALDMWADTLFEVGVTPTGTSAVRLEAVWDTAALLTRKSSFNLYTVKNGIQARKLSINSEGQLTLDKYGIGTFVNTPDYLLGVDANGNFVETSTTVATPNLQQVTDEGSTTTNNIRSQGTGRAELQSDGILQLTSFPSSNTAFIQATNLSIDTIFELPDKGGTETFAMLSDITGSFVTSVSGTANRITSTGGTTPIIDIGTDVVTLTGSQTLTNKTLTSPIFTGVASPTYTQGKLLYDTDNEALTFYNNDANVAMQIGQELWIRVRNVSGSTITNGKPVYITGSSSGLPTIGLAKADSASTVICVGLTTESIANNAIGYVTQTGVVRDFDTSAFTAGSTLFVDATTAGGLTTTAPTSPNYRMRVGIVVSSNATTGSVLVTPSTAALGNGTANQILGINSGGTAQEFKSTTGSGNVVLSTSPTLVTPLLGTPTSGVLTNTTGYLLNNISAATGSSTINSAANAIEWQWQPATTGSPAFSITENAINNTGTDVLMRVSSKSGSAAIPFQIQTRGTTVFSTAAAGGVSIGGGTGLNMGVAISTGTGNQTFTSTSATGSAFVFTGNSITTASAMTLSTNALTTGIGLALTSTSTAASSNTQTLFSALLSGANSNANQTTFGAIISNTHTGSGSINSALRLTASGGGTNYALQVSAGLSGFGTVTPTALVNIAAGTATAGTAPLKLTAGTPLTTSESGVLETDSSNNLWYTNSTAVRGKVQVNRVSSSSAATLALATTYSTYLFTGTTSTWTAATITGNTGMEIMLVNKGSGNITVNSNAGGNDFWTAGALSNTFTMFPGDVIWLYYDGTNILVLN